MDTTTAARKLRASLIASSRTSPRVAQAVARQRKINAQHAQPVARGGWVLAS